MGMILGNLLGGGRGGGWGGGGGFGGAVAVAEDSADSEEAIRVEAELPATGNLS